MVTPLLRIEVNRRAAIRRRNMSENDKTPEVYEDLPFENEDGDKILFYENSVDSVEK